MSRRAHRPGIRRTVEWRGRSTAPSGSMLRRKGCVGATPAPAARAAYHRSSVGAVATSMRRPSASAGGSVIGWRTIAGSTQALRSRPSSVAASRTAASSKSSRTRRLTDWPARGPSHGRLDVSGGGRREDVTALKQPLRATGRDRRRLAELPRRDRFAARWRGARGLEAREEILVGQDRRAVEVRHGSRSVIGRHCTGPARPPWRPRGSDRRPGSPRRAP